MLPLSYPDPALASASGHHAEADHLPCATLPLHRLHGASDLPLAIRARPPAKATTASSASNLARPLPFGCLLALASKTALVPPSARWAYGRHRRAEPNQPATTCWRSRPAASTLLGRLGAQTPCTDRSGQPLGRWDVGGGPESRDTIIAVGSAGDAAFERPGCAALLLQLRARQSTRSRRTLGSGREASRGWTWAN